METTADYCSQSGVLCQTYQGRSPISTLSSLSTTSAMAMATTAVSSIPSLSSSSHGKESIHSGQFMVSHFEAEAQDDDDTEIKMPDPDDPNYQKPEDLNLCTEIQLYIPQKINQCGDTSLITSHLEIETSLTKLFKCMNLAYRQKLTSPKWNHFKGVRLRWKDKIRLNNVIWRCWHMQFILKKRTPVCQFASPLDVDVHSNPQSVVLEGKYWKRQLSVIKAEYRKWRRNSKQKAIGGCSYDTKSEFDLLEWSPLSNDRNLMITEDWTSDTLFSAINVPFPFPDPREIARGAGIADFIQPSLGPLQPNLDDIDFTFQELLQSSRLPPVPEEGTEDINFPAIMGSEQLDSVSIMDVTNSTQTQQNIDVTPSIEDATMVDLNTQLSPLQQYAEKMCSNNLDLQSTSNVLESAASSTQELPMMSYNGIEYNESMMNEAASNTSLNSFQLSTANQMNLQNTSGITSSSSSGKNNILKGRVSKTFNRSFRKREPHNYDKAQPTLHQTNIYQQMLAEQTQKQQQQQQQQQQTQQSQLQLPIIVTGPSSNQFSTNSSVTNSDIFPVQNLQNNSASTVNLPAVMNQNIKSYSLPQAVHNSQLLNHKSLSVSSEILSILNVDNNLQDLYKSSSSAMQQLPGNSTYKTFANTQNLRKIPFPLPSLAGYMNVSSGGGINNLRQLSPTITGTLNKSTSNNYLIDQQQQQQQQQNQELQTKEMFRSNSLPLNSSLQKFDMKEDLFVMPKFHATKNRSRTRSSSTIHQPIQSVATAAATVSSFPVTSLQAATSEPLLNSTLAQLLTTNSSNKLSLKQSSAPATLNQNVIRMTPAFSSSSITYQHQQQQQQQQQQSPQSLTHQQQPQIATSQLSLSPTRSTSLPQPASLHSPPTTTKMMSFPPCLSPESYIDESPLSPTKSNSSNLGNLKFIKDSQRRVGHIHAEQKRRYNIKNGFDMLYSLIPQLQQNPNAKFSKAAMLQKGAEYIKQLRIERNMINDKMETLRKERDNLNASLSHLHSILPANGAPVIRQRTEKVKQLYSQYVRYRTMQNWKFWILGLILEPLLNSYTTTVSMASIEELYRTALLWVDQHCSLVELRPAVSNKLRYLSMTTDILSDPPSTLQEEVMKAINNSDGQHPNLNST